MKRQSFSNGSNIYNLSGQRVSEKDNLPKGVYIIQSVDGSKKVIR